jgi:hypothetical protein
VCRKLTNIRRPYPSANVLSHTPCAYCLAVRRREHQTRLRCQGLLVALCQSGRKETTEVQDNLIVSDNVLFPTCRLQTQLRLTAPSRPLFARFARGEGLLPGTFLPHRVEHDVLGKLGRTRPVIGDDEPAALILSYATRPRPPCLCPPAA